MKTSTLYILDRVIKGATIFKIVFLIKILFFTLIPSFSATNFYSINSLFNLSMRHTATVCKDSDGFIWTASKIGALRIDDENYRFYNFPYINTNVLSVKLLCNNFNLIAFSNNGQLFSYDKLKDDFIFIADLSELLNDRYIVIKDIVVRENNEMLIASSSGLHKLSSNNIVNAIEIEKSIHSIVEIKDDVLFYDSNQGLFQYDVKNNKSIPFIHQDIVDFNVEKFFYDEDLNSLWIGTQDKGLFIYDLNNDILKETVLSKIKHPILAIEKKSQESFLIGVDGLGVIEVSSDAERVLNEYRHDENNPFSLVGDGVYDILCDNNRIWIATYSGGLCYSEQNIPTVTLIKHQINTENSLVNNNVNDVLEDSEGNIWFATDNGISCWNRKTNKWDDFYHSESEQSNTFLTVCEDNNKQIWAGSYSTGIYVIDILTKKEVSIYNIENKRDGYTGKFIFDIFKDSQGDMWVGGTTVGDVLCYKVKEKTFKRYPSQSVQAFQELAPGKILLLCTYGILILDKETEEYEYVLVDQIAQDIVIDGNIMWVATGGNGLLKYDFNTKEFIDFSIKDGLPSNFINSIVKKDEFLWGGTESGLAQLKQEGDSLVIKSSSIVESYNAYNIGASILLNDGNLIFGTNNGALLFNPNNLAQLMSKGKIFIQDITISGVSIREIPKILNNTEVNLHENIKLNYDQNTISLDLHAVGGLSYDKAKFSWKLQGVDKEWTLPSSNPTISYAHIPVGKFNLSIKMYDLSLSQIIDTREIKFIVKPPFWKTAWFTGLGIIFFTVILFLAIKTYINQLKQKHAKDKIDFFTNIAHDLRTSLTLISAPIDEIGRFQNLPVEADYYLRLALDQSKRLVHVTTQLLDFQKADIGKEQLFLSMVDIVELVALRKSIIEALAKKANIKINYVANVDKYYSAIDAMKIEKAIDNLISNAIKYSNKNNFIDIRLFCDNSGWKLEVEDYGIGISEKAQKKLFQDFYRAENKVNSKLIGSGIGLLIVKKHVTMHGGNVELYSKEGEGTKFEIFVPYKEVDQNVIEANINTYEDISYVDIEEAFQNIEIEAKKDKLNLLIVEDNKELQNFLSHALSENYNISKANDGEIAWNIIKDNEPDLIISDIMMPNMDGFDLCRIIKNTAETSHIPIILLTALSDKTQELEGLGLGAEDYITKPFSVQVLMHRINNVLKNREKKKEETLSLINKQNFKEKSIFKNEHNDEFVKKAIEVVNDNISNTEFLKDDFAAEMNVSPSLLYKKLKSLADLSPVDFIRSIRLNYSVELLKTGKYNVTEVSDLAGFSSVGYFSYAFKKHFGVPPSELLN